MAFSRTKTNTRMSANGRVYQEGTWTSNGGTTGGTITIAAASATDEYPVTIGAVESFVVSNDNQNPTGYQIVGDGLRIVFTANDTGTYKLYGYAR